MSNSAVQAYLRYAIPAAKKYGVDPYAMMAVAGVESGWNPNSVGDGGTSYGYHQFHQGGAGGSNAKQYLNPQLNVETAARMFAEAGGRGLHGQAAVDAFVRKFERPANPGAEISKAMSYLSQYGKEQPGGGAAPPMMQMQQQMGGFNPMGQQQGADPLADSRQSLMQMLMEKQGNPDAQSQQLIQLLSQMNSAKLQNGPQALSPAFSGDMGMPSSPTQGQPKFAGGGYSGLPVGIKNYKLIGTPYSGTHTIGNWESDNAVDLGVPIGTPIVAVADGVIGDRIGSLGKGGRFAGLRVNLKSNNNAFYYAHLSRLAVHAGQHVKKGQVLGYSGEANGVAHLHFGVENGNPLKLFNLK